MMNDSHNIVVTIAIAFFGVATLTAIVLLSVFGKAIPVEITGIPTTVVGGLLGIAFGRATSVTVPTTTETQNVTATPTPEVANKDYVAH